MIKPDLLFIHSFIDKHLEFIGRLNALSDRPHPELGQPFNKERPPLPSRFIGCFLSDVQGDVALP
jgi:hypothetical protein